MSDFSVEISKSGAPVLKAYGRFLASSMDPVREARAWADRACAGLAKNESLIILGVGSGYHVMETRARGIPTIVIEESAALTAAVKELHPSLDGLITEPEWTALITHEKFREAINRPYRIAAHIASFQLAGEYYSRVDQLLRSRDSLSFLLTLKTRPELAALLDADELKKSKDEPVSIKTLERLFSAKASGTRERRLWRILEELVL